MKLKDSKYPSFYNAKATTAFFSAIMAATFASFYWLSRFGFDNNSIFVVLKVLSISYFLLFFPLTVRRVLDNFELTVEKSWYTSDAAISLLGLCFVTAAGFLIPSFNFIALSLFVLLGYLFFVINLIDYLSKNSTKNCIIFCFWSILFSTLILFMYLSKGGNHPLHLEALVRRESPGDASFHCAISQMIKTYGIPSTGLDGIPYAPYHYGSHFVFAQLSKLLDLNVFVFYQLGFTVIFIPFLFNSILSFIIELKKYFNRLVENWDLKTDYKFWIILIVPFVGFLPIRIMERLYTKNWIILSESYALGMSLFFILASLLLYFFEKFNSERRIFEIRDLVFLILVLPLLFGIIGLTKQSLIFLSVIILAYLFFRLKLYKNKMLIFSSLLTLVTSVIAFRLVATRYPHSYDVVFFDILKRFVIADKLDKGYFWILLVPCFFIFHFFWSWLYIALRMQEEKIEKIADIKNAFSKKGTIDIEILFLLCIVGTLPGMLLKVRGGVAIYFSDLQRWIALSFLLSRFSNFSLPNIKMQFRKINTLVLFSLLFIAIGSFLSNVVMSAKVTIGQNIGIRNYLNSLSNPSQKDNSEENDKSILRLVKSSKKFIYGPQKSLYENEIYKMYKTLLRLDKIPLPEKRKTLLFIPRSNRLFWDWLHPREVSMVVPALSGIAMVDGLPEEAATSEFSWLHWCFYRYKANAKGQSLFGTSPDKVYSKVLERGFSKVIIIESKNGNTVITRIP